MPREEAALTVGKLLPRGGHARKALVSHLAGTVQPMLVRSHAIPNSAVIAGALLAASQGLFVKGAPKRVGDGLQAQVRHLTGGVGAADIGAASRAIERALEHRGAIFAGLPESCGEAPSRQASLLLVFCSVDETPLLPSRASWSSFLTLSTSVFFLVVFSFLLPVCPWPASF